MDKDNSSNSGRSPIRVSRLHMSDLETAYLGCRNEKVRAEFDAMRKDPGFCVVDNPEPDEFLTDLSIMFMYTDEIIMPTNLQLTQLAQEDHANMMTAIQSFISPAISKTLNCPSDMRCQACKDGDDDPRIECGFTSGAFDGRNNYRCATVNQIRDFIADNPRIHITYGNDQNYATIFVGDVDELSIDGQPDPICLWVGWYKQRGRTEGMWLMFENDPPRPPTEKECLAIIRRRLAHEHY